MKYLDMIQSAIITLAERGGSSRQGLWKVVSAQHPEADYKQFLVRLKKESHEGNIIRVGQRFKLDPAQKKKIISGKSSAKKSKATMKKSKKRQQKRSQKSGTKSRGKGRKSTKRGKKSSGRRTGGRK